MELRQNSGLGDNFRFVFTQMNLIQRIRKRNPFLSFGSPNGGSQTFVGWANSPTVLAKVGTVPREFAHHGAGGGAAPFAHPTAPTTGSGFRQPRPGGKRLHSDLMH
jgi:hypothetical protein